MSNNNKGVELILEKEEVISQSKFLDQEKFILETA
jgi:hypothetical protein